MMMDGWQLLSFEWNDWKLCGGGIVCRGREGVGGWSWREENCCEVVDDDHKISSLLL